MSSPDNLLQPLSLAMLASSPAREQISPMIGGDGRRPEGVVGYKMVKSILTILFDFIKIFR